MIDAISTREIRGYASGNVTDASLDEVLTGTIGANPIIDHFYS